MRLIFLAVLATVASGASAQNLIINGGFEDPATAPGLNYNYGGGQSFTGWEVVGPIGNAVTILNSTYSETNIRFQSQSGLSALDLTGAGNVGTSAGVTQTVTTQAGQSYLLQFWVGNADGSGNGAFALPSTIGLSVNDGVRVQYTNSDVSSQAVQWASYTVRIAATSTQTKISFFNETPSGDRYAGLDNVSLTPVDENGTLALMLAGLALLPSIIYKRKRRVVHDA